MEILETIAAEFNIPTAAISSKSRDSLTLYARAVAINLLRPLGTSTQIGLSLNRDHSTVLHSELVFAKILRIPIIAYHYGRIAVSLGLIRPNERLAHHPQEIIDQLIRTSGLSDKPAPPLKTSPQQLALFSLSCTVYADTIPDLNKNRTNKNRSVRNLCRRDPLFAATLRHMRRSLLSQLYSAKPLSPSTIVKRINTQICSSKN